jgi:hypothetical protein
LQYANKKSVPGLVTIISWPSNLTFRSMLENLSQEEAPARGSTGAQVFRTAGPLEKASPMRLARSGLGYCGKAATARKNKGRRPKPTTLCALGLLITKGYRSAIWLCLGPSCPIHYGY